MNLLQAWPLQIRVWLSTLVATQGEVTASNAPRPAHHMARSLSCPGKEWAQGLPSLSLTLPLSHTALRQNSQIQTHLLGIPSSLALPFWSWVAQFGSRSPVQEVQVPRPGCLLNAPKVECSPPHLCCLFTPGLALCFQTIFLAALPN